MDEINKKFEDIKTAWKQEAVTAGFTVKQAEFLITKLEKLFKVLVRNSEEIQL